MINKLKTTDSTREFRECYSWLIHDADTYEKDVNGLITAQYDEAYEQFILSILKIEEFVAEVLSTADPGFRVEMDRFGKSRLRPLPLARHFNSILALADRYSAAYRFSAHVQLFFDCWDALGPRQVHFSYPHAYSTAIVGPYSVFNYFVESIRYQSKTDEFKRQLSRQKEKSIQNFQSAVSYIDRLLKRCARLLVLRIDFSYLAEHSHRVSAETAKEDFAHFLENRRSNQTLFASWEGYLWKLEWGPLKGCHFHLIIFFNGSERHKDAYIAQQLGDYWKTITKGRGIYWNCNSNIEKYKRLGIGMLDHFDEKKLKVLREDVVRYFTKSDQYLRATALGESKRFGRGIMPAERESKAGRPRKDRGAPGREE